MPPKPLLRGCNRPRHQRQSPQRPPPLPPPRSAGWAGQFSPDSSFHQILSVSRKLKTSFHFSQKANGKWYEMIKTDADNSAGVGGSICNTVSYPTFGSNCNTEMAQFATHKDLQTNPLGFWVGTRGQASWTKLPPSWEQAHWGLELIAKQTLDWTPFRVLQSQWK